jgi:hypothetical protein
MEEIITSLYPDVNDSTQEGELIVQGRERIIGK